MSLKAYSMLTYDIPADSIKGPVLERLLLSEYICNDILQYLNSYHVQLFLEIPLAEFGYSDFIRDFLTVPARNF